MTQPPARILQQYLEDAGFISAQEDDGDWPGFVSFMPDKVIDLVAVYDTQGLLDGRYMTDGVYVEHPGVQIRVRSKTYLTGWRKAKELQNALAAIEQEQVTIDDEIYTIHNATVTAPIAVMGQDPDTDRRENFSINARLTLAESNP